MTKTAFLAAYRAEITGKYTWTQDASRVAGFMDQVASTINRPNGGGPWNHSGPTTDIAWKAIGGKGKPTLKGLRALPA